jgi:hypothetical protein
LRRTWALRPELRPRAPLPADLPVHLAIAARDTGDAAALVDLVRAHGFAGLVLVGASDEELDAWTRATAGRCRLATFGDLRTLRRRMKSRGSADDTRAPWVVQVHATAAPAAGEASSIDAVVDELRTCTRAQSGAEPSALVLLADAVGGEADAVWNVGALARASTHDGDRAAAQASKVAPPVGIADPPTPSPRVVAAVAAADALAGFLGSRERPSRP